MMSASGSSSFTNNTNNNDSPPRGSTRQLPTSSNTTISSKNNGGLKRPKRMCRFPGCPNVIKSQGHCQTHGAIVKRCKVENCMMQSQGGQFNGMCKRHYKESLKQESNAEETNAEEEVPVDVGPSVYDRIIPFSAAWQQGEMDTSKIIVPNISNVSKNNSSTKGATKIAAHGACSASNQLQDQVVPKSNHTNSTTTLPPSKAKVEMPLVAFLRSGRNLEPGWHRKNERLIQNPKNPLRTLGENFTPEEKQLILLETCLLSGIHNSYSDRNRTSRDFAHAWGKGRGFSNRLITQTCQRRGDISRRQRCDTGIKKVKSDTEAIQKEKQV